MTRSFRWFCIPLCLAFVQAIPACGAGPDVAYVLQVSGLWASRRAPSQNLHPGQGLQSGDSLALRNAPRRSDLLIVVGARDNKIVVQRRCSVDDCLSPASVPENLGAEDSLSARVLRSVMQRWLGEGSVRYSGLESRGGPDVLYEGVVEAGVAGADLLPVVGDLSPGSYTLAWLPIAVDGRETPAAPPPVLLEIGPGKPARILTTLLSPGLYTVQAFREGPSGGIPVAEAWVLAAGACSSTRAAGSFDEIVATSETWAAEVSGDTVRRFLRAGLFGLAATLPPCPK